MDAAVWVAAGSALAAIASAIAAWQSVQAARRSSNAAQRSAAAAESSSEHARRSADAAEESLHTQKQQLALEAETAAAKKRAEVIIEAWDRRRGLVIRNAGEAMATNLYAVRIMPTRTTQASSTPSTVGRGEEVAMRDWKPTDAVDDEEPPRAGYEKFRVSWSSPDGNRSDTGWAERPTRR